MADAQTKDVPQGFVGRFVRVPDGREYLLRLPNVASTPLSDLETAEMLTWVVRRFGARELPWDFVPFSADEVARTRHRPLIDVDRARRAVLDQLADDAPAPARLPDGR